MEAGPHTEGDLTELACAVSRGDVAGQVLARQPRRVTVRVEATGGPVIVKLWNLRDPRGAARLALRRTKGRGEWDSLRTLRRAGVPVPRALAFFPLRGAGVRHQEALVAEDLAPCEPLHGRMHALSKAGDAAGVDRLGERVIRITRGMVDANVLDNDHRLGNFIVRPDGAVCRLDFENARVGLRGARREDALGVMIGALVASHAWVSRCAPSDSSRFVERLKGELDPTPRAMDRARRSAAREIERLQRRSGLTLANALGW